MDCAAVETATAVVPGVVEAGVLVLGGVVLGGGLVVAGVVLAGPVLAGTVLAGAVGTGDVAGIEEFCAAGEDGTPPATAGLPPALPECPAKAVTAA